VLAFKKHPLVATQKEISTQRSKITERIASWRVEQAQVMPTVLELLADRAECEVEAEVLHLPSDFGSEGRRERRLMSLGLEEGRLREAAAYESLKNVQKVAKGLSSMKARKRKDAKGQGVKTAAQNYIDDAEIMLQQHIKNYMNTRKALMALGACTGAADDFPVLTEEDTRQKSTEGTRELGASRHRDGWATAGISAAGRARGKGQTAASSSSGNISRPAVGGTVMAPRRAAGTLACLPRA
jgi:hypothetical protein